jgi:hypothetical protein
MTFARPKSITFACPRIVTIMLCGLILSILLRQTQAPN